MWRTKSKSSIQTSDFRPNYLNLVLGFLDRFELIGPNLFIQRIILNVIMIDVELLING